MIYPINADAKFLKPTIMKNIAIIIGILITGFSAHAKALESSENYRGNYTGSAFIFVENNVEFSVFPDGQFDFIYVGPQKGTNIIVSSPNLNVSFNSGYNYDAYVQYDMYGAVIQVENVPVYYDEYGRIIRAGNVDIRYNDRRIVNIGGLRIFYNNYGNFSHCSGYINAFNPYYVYHPWHAYYSRPLYTHVIVYDYPYRQYYKPVRYSYHDHVVYYKNRNNVAYQNSRREFYRPGSRIHTKQGQVRVNTDFNPNRTNTMVATTGRNNSGSTRADAGSIRNSSENVRSNTGKEGNSAIRSENSNVNVRAGETKGPNIKNNGAPGRNNNSIRQSEESPVRNSNTAKTRIVEQHKGTSNTLPRNNTQTATPNRNISSGQSNVTVNRTSVRNNASENPPRQNNSIRTRG